MDVTPHHRGTWPAPVLSKGLLAGRSALWCIVVLAVGPCALKAQNDPRAAVDTAHFDYLEAYQVYQDTRSTWDEMTARWENLFDQLNRARERGDESTRSRLQPEIQGVAEERQDALKEFRSAEGEWYEAGRVLIQRVGAYQNLLSNRLLVADEETQDVLLDEYSAMDALRDDVREQMGPQEPLRLPQMPTLEALPEDTPAERRRKANSFDGFVATLGRLLEDLGTEIRRLELDLQTENIMRAWERDAAGRRNVPTGVGGAGAGGTGADTTEVDLDEPTLAQQIQNLKELQANVERIQIQYREQAEALRRRSGGTP